MIEKTSCQSKTGLAIPPTGKKSRKPSANVRKTVAKEVPPILTAEPKMEIHTLLPEVESSSPSPTSTTSLVTANQKTCEPGVSDAISNMTLDIMLKPEGKELVLSDTTSKKHYSDGKIDKSKKLTRKQLQKSFIDKPEDLLICQVMAESYRPAMDSIKAALCVWGSNSKFPLYGVINKQIAAKCQMHGINDPNATRRKRIAALTMFEDVCDVHQRAIQLGFDKVRMEEMRKEQLTKTALFHGLGSKKDLKQSQRKGTNK